MRDWEYSAVVIDCNTVRGIAGGVNRQGGAFADTFNFTNITAAVRRELQAVIVVVRRIDREGIVVDRVGITAANVNGAVVILRNRERIAFACRDCGLVTIAVGDNGRRAGIESRGDTLFNFDCVCAGNCQAGFAGFRICRQRQSYIVVSACAVNRSKCSAVSLRNFLRTACEVGAHRNFFYVVVNHNIRNFFAAVKYAVNVGRKDFRLVSVDEDNIFHIAGNRYAAAFGNFNCKPRRAVNVVGVDHVSQRAVGCVGIFGNSDNAVFVSLEQAEIGSVEFISADREGFATVVFNVSYRNNRAALNNYTDIAEFNRDSRISFFACSDSRYAVVSKSDCTFKECRAAVSRRDNRQRRIACLEVCVIDAVSCATFFSCNSHVEVRRQSGIACAESDCNDRVACVVDKCNRAVVVSQCGHSQRQICSDNSCVACNSCQIERAFFVDSDNCCPIVLELIFSHVSRISKELGAISEQADRRLLVAVVANHEGLALVNVANRYDKSIHSPCRNFAAGCSNCRVGVAGSKDRFCNTVGSKFNCTIEKCRCALDTRNDSQRGIACLECSAVNRVEAGAAFSYNTHAEVCRQSGIACAEINSYNYSISQSTERVAFCIVVGEFSNNRSPVCINVDDIFFDARQTNFLSFVFKRNPLGAVNVVSVIVNFFSGENNFLVVSEQAERGLLVAVAANHEGFAFVNVADRYDRAFSRSYINFAAGCSDSRISFLCRSDSVSNAVGFKFNSAFKERGSLACRVNRRSFNNSIRNVVDDVEFCSVAGRVAVVVEYEGAVAGYSHCDFVTDIRQDVGLAVNQNSVAARRRNVVDFVDCEFAAGLCKFKRLTVSRVFNFEVSTNQGDASAAESNRAVFTIRSDGEFVSHFESHAAEECQAAGSREFARNVNRRTFGRIANNIDNFQRGCVVNLHADFIADIGQAFDKDRAAAAFHSDSNSLIFAGVGDNDNVAVFFGRDKSCSKRDNVGIGGAEFAESGDAANRDTGFSIDSVDRRGSAVELYEERALIQSFSTFVIAYADNRNAGVCSNREFGFFFVDFNRVIFVAVVRDCEESVRTKTLNRHNRSRCVNLEGDAVSIRTSFNNPEGLVADCVFSRRQNVRLYNCAAAVYSNYCSVFSHAGDISVSVNREFACADFNRRIACSYDSAFAYGNFAAVESNCICVFHEYTGLAVSRVNRKSAFVRRGSKRCHKTRRDRYSFSRECRIECNRNIVDTDISNVRNCVSCSEYAVCICSNISRLVGGDVGRVAGLVVNCNGVCNEFDINPAVVVKVVGVIICSSFDKFFVISEQAKRSLLVCVETNHEGFACVNVADGTHFAFDSRHVDNSVVAGRHDSRISVVGRNNSVIRVTTCKEHSTGHQRRAAVNITRDKEFGVSRVEFSAVDCVSSCACSNLNACSKVSRQSGIAFSRNGNRRDNIFFVAAKYKRVVGVSQCGHSNREIRRYNRSIAFNAGEIEHAFAVDYEDRTPISSADIKHEVIAGRIRKEFATISEQARSRLQISVVANREGFAFVNVANFTNHAACNFNSNCAADNREVGII